MALGFFWNSLDRFNSHVSSETDCVSCFIYLWDTYFRFYLAPWIACWDFSSLSWEVYENCIYSSFSARYHLDYLVKNLAWWIMIVIGLSSLSTRRMGLNSEQGNWLLVVLAAHTLWISTRYHLNYLVKNWAWWTMSATHRCPVFSLCKEAGLDLIVSKDIGYLWTVLSTHPEMLVEISVLWARRFYYSFLRFEHFDKILLKPVGLRIEVLWLCRDIGQE